MKRIRRAIVNELHCHASARNDSVLTVTRHATAWPGVDVGSSMMKWGEHALACRNDGTQLHACHSIREHEEIVTKVYHVVKRRGMEDTGWPRDDVVAVAR